jgi:hypothetical protein
LKDASRLFGRQFSEIANTQYISVTTHAYIYSQRLTVAAYHNQFIARVPSPIDNRFDVLGRTIKNFRVKTENPLAVPAETTHSCSWREAVIGTTYRIPTLQHPATKRQSSSVTHST